jgi:hypothetical protein
VVEQVARVSRHLKTTKSAQIDCSTAHRPGANKLQEGCECKKSTRLKPSGQEIGHPRISLALGGRRVRWPKGGRSDLGPRAQNVTF